MKTAGRGLPIDWTQPSWSARIKLFRNVPHKLNFSNFIYEYSKLFGSRTAFILDEPISYPGFEGRVVSYNDIERLVSKMAHALQKLGVERGDRVGLITVNRIEMSFMMFACGRMGAIPVPMNFMLRPAEVQTIMERAGSHTLIFDANIDVEIASIDVAKTKAIIGAARPGIDSIAELMSDAPDHIHPVEPRSRTDTAFLFYTSGTTGFPKGAMISHEAALVGAIWSAGKMSLQPVLPRNLMLHVMPVAHAGGYAALLITLASGIPGYFLRRFDPARIVHLIKEHHVTVMSGTPAMYRILLENGLREAELSSIRHWGGGADAFSEDLVREMREIAARKGPFGIKLKPLFFRGYGMAEANSHVATTPPFPTPDNCIGWILKPVKFRIVDEEGRDASQGELWISGPNVTRGYWNDDEATKAAFSGDWFRTGDIVRKGKWRMLYFVDRSNDIIKSGGYKIAASEIEMTLTQHPDVEHAAVVGIPDEMKGQKPVAAVQLRSGATASTDELLEWARERIAPYKCPRMIFSMPDMPFTFSIKPKRNEVKEKIMSLLSSERS
ncbi:MAG: class I adenylate-forming enzyme family protein [Actinomycetota bacterium]